MIKEIFPIRIYESYIEDSSYYKIRNDLQTYIPSNKDNFKIVNSWLGNTMTDFPITKFYSKELEQEIYKHSYKYIEGLNPHIYELTIGQVWVNLNLKNTFQEEHHHLGSGAQFSGTIYINTVDHGGDFEIINSNNYEYYNDSNIGNIERFKVTIKPEIKKIIIFPSYLMHRVTPNNTDETRLSVSFNISRKKLDKFNKYGNGNPEKYGYIEKN